MGQFPPYTTYPLHILWWFIGNSNPNSN